MAVHCTVRYTNTRSPQYGTHFLRQNVKPNIVPKRGLTLEELMFISMRLRVITSCCALDRPVIRKDPLIHRDTAVLR